MTVPRYKALTWDHPRGYHALAAAAREVALSHGVAIEWDRQPLEGFESHPIADLCARYDLVVLDHPHIGEAVAAECLTPLEAMFEPEVLAEIAAATIGPCLASYRYAGRHWALPLDAASQVLAWRPDLIEGPPGTWEEVESAARDNRFALSVAGPHAILSIFSIAAACGAPPAEQDPATLLDEEAGIRAVELVARLHARADRGLLEANPIGILEHMAHNDDIAFCPLVYGYVTYTRPAPGARAVAFADAPAVAPAGRPGSTLGGTGIGISRRAEVTPGLIAHLLWLMGEAAQLSFIPAHDGQPSRRQAWADGGVNARWGGFYRATAATLEAAYVRPRHRGYIAFQTEASGYLRSALADRLPSHEVVRQLNRMHRQSIGDQER